MIKGLSSKQIDEKSSRILQKNLFMLRQMKKDVTSHELRKQKF